MNNKTIKFNEAFPDQHDKMEGFDDCGLYWYRLRSSKMEPEIKRSSMLAIRPSDMDEVGEGDLCAVFVKVIKDFYTLTGRVFSGKDDRHILMRFAGGPEYDLDIEKRYVRGMFKVVYAGREMA